MPGNIQFRLSFVALVMREGYQPARPHSVARPQGARAPVRQQAAHRSHGRRGRALLPGSARRAAPDARANRASARHARRHHRRPGDGPDRSVAAVAGDVPHRADICGLCRARSAPRAAFAGAALSCGAACTCPKVQARAADAAAAFPAGRRRSMAALGDGGRRAAEAARNARRAVNERAGTAGHGAVHGDHGHCADPARHADGGRWKRPFPSCRRR